MPEATSNPALESIARSSLLEMTTPESIGPVVETRDDGDGIVTLFFAADMVGYPGWRWTVSISNFDDQEPSVLETELTPGEGALLAPDWVPWSDRLADYKAAQEGEEASEGDADESDDDSDDDDSDDDDDDDESEESEEDDDDDLGSDILHGGDLDGVDIDEADTAIADDADDSDDSDDETDADDESGDDPDGDESSEDADDDDPDDEDADPDDEGEKTY